MMFRTRDLGRWTTDGELEHLGRTDDQVKIRGFHVELDSVLSVLETTPGCSQAVTLKLDPAPGRVCLPAGRRRRGGEAVVARSCRTTACRLVVALDELPITSRGKIDKRALLALPLQGSDRGRGGVRAGGR